MLRPRYVAAAAFAAVSLFPPTAHAQSTVADYRRAMELRERVQALPVNVPEPAVWVDKAARFWYRKSVAGGNEFVMVDAASLAKRPPFDHQRLADSLNAAVKPVKSYTAVTLPFTTFSLDETEGTLQFNLDAAVWRCRLATYTCADDSARGRRGGGGGRGGGLAGPVAAEFDINGAEPRKSPDGKLEATVNNYNVAIREVGQKAVTVVTTDGSEGGYYDPRSLVWSPDSKRIAVYRIKPGFRRYVHYVESSPEDQLQPKHSTLQYAKPGDVLDVERPVIVDVATKRTTVVDPALFPNAYDQTPLVWRKDSQALTFEYNQRGHQVYRIIEVDATTGAARSVVSEEATTFFCYSGKKYRFDVADGREVLWMSERDGWNHLYLYDGRTGAVKNQITKGAWLVRAVLRVDEQARQIWFSASGMYPGKDPYFVHYYRINFDGSGLMPLTSADANHTVTLSTDGKYYVDTYSRIDLAPVSELRRSADASLAGEIERGDITALVKAGWKAPEPFMAKGRDGSTDIYGRDLQTVQLRPVAQVPGDRKHLRRAA